MWGVESFGATVVSCNQKSTMRIRVFPERGEEARFVGIAVG